MRSRFRSPALAGAIVLLACVAGPGPFATTVLASDHALARYRTLSPPDCVDAISMVRDHEPAPTNVTFMRVEHMGDPGTEENEQQAANVVTWPLSTYTGLIAMPGSQRGYRDLFGNSGFQLHCTDAGFFINTATFSHAVPIAGEGPNVSVARNYDPPLAPFAAGDSLLLEADVRVPWLATTTPPVNDGTAQVGFFLYYHDRTTDTAIAQLVALLDNRAPGVNGSGVEGASNDEHTDFVSSPLAAVDGRGEPVRFVTPGPGSAQMQYAAGWPESRHFAAIVTPGQWADAVAVLRSKGAAISAHAADYVVTSFGLLGEVFPGPTRDHEVTLGVSVSNLALRAIPVRIFAHP